MDEWIRKARIDSAHRGHTLSRLGKWLVIGVSILFMLNLTGCSGHFIGMLNPKGLVAFQERKLFFDTLALMLVVVLPVIIMSLTFVYHYQISHRIADYKPNWGHSYFLESLWWGIPCVIIFILAVMTWRQTHELDPYRRMTGYSEKPIIIQVIALPWKWLFIYPDENIATINYLEIPVGQQVEFWITTDNVPMSAFFIPQLGSQIYTMAGMRTRLHLVANEIGLYDGLNTQYNGDGFSEMHFSVHVVDPIEMASWIAQVKKAPDHLTLVSYDQLLNQSIDNKSAFFSGVEGNLFNTVMATYMTSTGTLHPRTHQLKLHYQTY